MWYVLPKMVPGAQIKHYNRIEGLCKWVEDILIEVTRQDLAESQVREQLCRMNYTRRNITAVSVNVTCELIQW